MLLIPLVKLGIFKEISEEDVDSNSINSPSIEFQKFDQLHSHWLLEFRQS